MAIEETDPKKKGDASGSNSELNLHVNDPLFLHANDSNGKPLITFKLTGTDNYKIWAADVHLVLYTKNKLGFINSKCVRDESNVLLQEQWDGCNFVVLSWILGCISQDLYQGQLFSKIAKSVWDEFKKTFDKIDGTPSPSTAYQINRIMALIGSKPDSGKLQFCVAGTFAFSNHIVVSGATQHMIFSTEHLYDVIDASHLKIIVSHPNGTVELVKHVVNYKISDKIILKDVLVVPGYKDSLQRLGHPSDQVLTTLKDKIQIDSLFDI
ncbi:ribonuclease H-like domain-containing protein [Tanacetum coccineum]